MQSIRQVQRLNDLELEKCVPPNASWHTDYRDTAYIYIGGLPFELSEGDILTIFSQYGNPVHINLIRDKDTGKSRGFAFLKYEDQRSCDLAVDNLSGAGVMGRVLSVDHTRYKKKDGEVETLGDEQEQEDTDKEDEKRRKRRQTSESENSEEDRPMIPEEVELAKLLRDHDDDDPMKAYLVKEKKAEVEEALKAAVKLKSRAGDGKRRRQHHHRSRREDGQTEDDERRKESHRPSRIRSDDEGDRELRHRSYRSRRRRSNTPDSRGEHYRRMNRSSRDNSNSDEDKARHSRKNGRRTEVAEEPPNRSHNEEHRRPR